MDNNKLDLSKLDINQLNKILDTLTPKEKELALSVLNEYANTGHSKLLDDIILEDYAEIPVDIETFVDSNEYLGYAWHDAQGKSKLYPYWRKELRKLFPDNITTTVNNTILSGSRGRGKTEVAILIISYLLHRLLCLKNPIQYFNLKPTEKIVFAFMNIKLALAEEIALSKFQNTIQSSPWFMRHGYLEGRTKKIWYPQKYNDQVAIDIKIGSQADDVIGLPIYAAFFDEISFIKNKDVEKQKEKANDMIDTAIGGMKTRFVHKGKNPTMLILASSKRSDKSFLEEHMKKKLKSEKTNVYISDGSVWEVKPEGTYSKETFSVAVGSRFLPSVVIPEGVSDKEYKLKGYGKIIHPPIDFRADFLDDIDRALCDFAGISSSSLTKYIYGPDFVALINSAKQNAFDQEILEIGTGPEDKDVQYYHHFHIDKIDPELLSKPLYIHLDMSKTHDKTGIAGIFIRGKKPSTDPNMQDRDLFYSLGFAVSIKAPKGYEISFEKNRQFIRWLKDKGFKIKGITCDTFQSADLQQILKAEGYPIETLSVDRVSTDQICLPYQAFKSAITEKRLEIFEDNLLIEEVTNLERNMETGKVDHPDGGCFTGETKVRLTDGRSLNFFDLVKEYESGKQNYVYSMNLDKKIIEPKKIIKAWKTLENQPLVKITFDNDESVECTLNHKFMLRNGSYLEAQELLPGDSLMPLYTKYPDKGGLTGYRMYYEPFEDKWHFEHRKFAKEILDEKHLVHHKDCNKINNNPDNLIWMSKKAHVEVHSNNGDGAYSKEALIKKSQSVKKWHENNRDTNIYQDRSEKTRRSLLETNYKKYGHNRTVDWKNHIKEIEETFNVKWDDLTDSEKNSYGGKLARLKDPTIGQRVSNSLSKKHEEGYFENAKKALHEYNQKTKMLKKLYPEVDKSKFLELFGFDFDSLVGNQKAVWTNRYRHKLYDILNHKVIKIEFISKKSDVYDIEVEDNHNFALDCGVFVHNSKDKSDAVCGALYNASKHAEEFALFYGESETAKLTLQINGNDNVSGFSEKDQFTVAWEEELKKMSGMLDQIKRTNDKFDKTGRTDYVLVTDDIIIY